MVIACVSVLLLVRIDYILFEGYPDLFRLTVACRAGYVLATVGFAFAVNKTTKVRIFDRLVIGWILFTIIFLGLFNFTRPANYLSTPFDIILPFAIYTLSPLPMKYTLALAVGCSIGTLYVDHFHKFGVDPIALSVVAYALVIVHVLGISAALQLQSYRRRSFKAYLDEKDAKEMVAFLSNIDMLTKSLTRRQFLNIAESEFRRFLRYRRPLSILIIDADHFKSINDTYGHHAGDLTLRSLSLVAMEQKRAQDTFGRLGGEEFGLLMPETNLAQAVVVAERIRQTWEQTPVNLDGELIHSSVSIGAAEAVSDDESIEDILRRTDRMLYKAKEAGRNQVMSE
jgi:diguanylate cyclase (GGDEF)-like protein